MSKKVNKSLHILLVFTLILSLSMNDLTASAATNDFDTIIRGGTVIDGSGLDRYDADVAIKDGYIAKVGDLSDATADQEIQAEGNFVAPGFIDVHSHAELAALQEAKSSLTQGVTMEVLSPDGGGPTNVQDRFDLEDSGLGINIATYIGFNSVWSQVVGNEDRRATAEEIQEMQSLITTAMEKGAAGVSAGLFYRPAYFADTDEVIETVSVAKDWRTNFSNHQRNENNEVLEATAETISIGETAGLSPVITHIKTMGPENWGKSVEMMQMIHDANERGVYAAADIYPYLRSQTGLTAIVPPWVEEGGRSAMLERFADPDLRDTIAAEIEEIIQSRVQGPEGIYFPTKRKTLADYMETGVGDVRNRMYLSFLNLDYNTAFDVDIEQLKVTNSSGNVAYEYNFEGNDGDEWDASKFDRLHTYPANALEYSIQDNVGHVNVAPRRQGNASAYGNVTPAMPDVGKNSETFMRFKVGDTVGSNQIIRLWINSDGFGSGSSFAMNGYGVAVRLDQNRIQVQERANSSTTLLDTITNAGIEPDTWLDLKLKMENETFSVKMWPSSEEEPEEWNSTTDVSKEEVVEDQQAMVSVSNLDSSSNTVYLDDFKVESASGAETYFDYNFDGNNGAAWNDDKFSEIHAFPENSSDISIADNTGKVTLSGYDDDLCCSTYAKFTPAMDAVKNSDVLLRFKADEIGGNQQIRIFTKADEFKSGMAVPVNGFGIELDLKDNEMSLINRDDSTTKVIETTDANLDTEWQTLRLHAEDDEVSARVWKDGEEEPADWDITYAQQERELTPGEMTMQILETEGSLRTIYDFGHEDDFERFIQSPLIAIASDGGATTSDSTHARRYGTQPRVLGKYVREEGLLSWEEAVRKMTSLPAALIGLSDRGYIAAGMKADITIFDPETIIDKATFDNPQQYAEGVEHVLVNGDLALTNGELTGTKAGKAVRVEPNMPTRPATISENIEVSEDRAIVELDGTETDSSIALDLEQGASDVKAAGSMTIINDGLELVAEDFGTIQTFDGWMSFTGSGIVNGEAFTTFRVTIDENDPQIDDEKPVITIDIVGQEQIKAFLGDRPSEEVDKTDLEAKIKEIENANLDESEYTEPSWDAFTAALDAAKEVLDDDEATQSQVDHALSSLEDAYNGLEQQPEDVNKEELENKVAEIKDADLEESLYTEESWSTLSEALANAEEVLENDNATQAEVDEALSNLENAYADLEPRVADDKEALENKVQEINDANLDESLYKEVSWSALEAALQAAEEVLNDDQATQIEVDEALENLIVAYENLEEKTVEVDRQALEDKVNEIEEADLDESAFTEASWLTLTEALEAAEEILAADNQDITQAMVNTALADLEAAYENLEEIVEVDKTKLQSRVDEIVAEGLTDSDYTLESWEALEAALTAAEAVVSNEEATQEEVDDALAALNAAYDGLEEKQIDKTKLQSRVDEIVAEDLTDSDYTSESWEAFETALTVAEVALLSDEVTQEEVDNALAGLNSAYDGLVEKKDPIEEVDKSQLQSKVNEITGENLQASNYTEESWTVFATALTTAEEVLADEKATQGEVDHALAALNNAYEGLEEKKAPIEKVDKSQLQSKVDEIAKENLQASDYTDSSWQVFINALTAAEAVLADDEATQKEVDNALEILNEALADLEKRPSSPDDKQDPIDDSKDPINNGKDKHPGNTDGGGAKDGEELPSTATPYYNWLLMGLLFTGLAGIVWLLNRKRRIQK